MPSCWGGFACLLFILGCHPLLSVKELAEFTFDTIREQTIAMSVPKAIAEAMAIPRDWLNKKIPPIMTNYMASADHAKVLTRIAWFMPFALVLPRFAGGVGVYGRFRDACGRARLGGSWCEAHKGSKTRSYKLNPIGCVDV